MSGPMAVLRLLVGWLLVVGLAVYVIQHPEQVMEAIAQAIEAAARWLDQQVNGN